MIDMTACDSIPGAQEVYRELWKNYFVWWAKIQSRQWIKTQYWIRKIRKSNVTSQNSSVNRSSPGPTLGTSSEEFCQMAQRMQWLMFFSLSVPVSSPRYSWIVSPLLSSLPKSMGPLRRSWKEDWNVILSHCHMKCPQQGAGVLISEGSEMWRSAGEQQHEAGRNTTLSLPSPPSKPPLDWQVICAWKNMRSVC